MYDVIVIGAGPAGSAAGFDLASAGLSVLMLDRKKFPRKKACAGGITPKAMALFAYDIDHLVQRVCCEVKIIRPQNTSFIIRNKKPLCYMTRRTDVDAYMLNQAQNAGCGFRYINRLVSLGREGDRVRATVVSKKKEIHLTARYIVGADGANSRVRQMLGRPLIRIAKCPALEADVRVARPLDCPMTIDFSKKIPGYYWIFPKQDHVNIGIFGAQPNVAMNRSLLAEYARSMLKENRLEAVKGYPIGVNRDGGYPGRGRVLLAGDAAGLAEPLFGEGIYFALKSGRLAAQSIIHGMAYADRPSERRPSSVLRNYHHSLTGVSRDLKLHRLGADVLYRFPGVSLSFASLPAVHNYFSKGYAQGRTISKMLLPF